MDSISFSQLPDNQEDHTDCHFPDEPEEITEFELLLILLSAFKGSGIPNSVREALIARELTDAALVLDICYFVGMPEQFCFTVDLLYQLAQHSGIGVSKKLLRRGLNSAAFPMRERPTTRRRGQPPVVYRVPPLKWLRETFTDGRESAADTLCAGDLASACAYRKGLYRTFIERRSGQYSRAFLGKRLGITARATANYDTPCGIVVMPVYEQTPLETQADLDTLPQKQPQPGRDFLMIYDTREDYELAQWSQKRHGCSIHDYGRAYPLLRFPAYRARRHGQLVCRVRRMANFYCAA